MTSSSRNGRSTARRNEAAPRRVEAKGLIYEGVLEPPKGKLPEDWEDREQTLFRSTAFGDEPTGR